MLSPKRTPIWRSADLPKETLQTTTEGVVTYSTLTQGKAAPREGGTGEGTRESAHYRVTADPGRGKDHPRPPAHQEMSHRDRGRDLETYTRGAAHQLIFTNKRDKSFIGRTDVEAETPILWPPDVKS